MPSVRTRKLNAAVLPLPLLLLSLLSLLLAVQLCVFAPVGVAAAGNTDEYTPLRISVSTVDLTVTGKYCAVAGTFVNGVNCSEEMVLTDAKRENIIKNILPAAVDAHQKRLKVQRQAGNITVSSCGPATIPEAHKTIGVAADFILYVLAPPTANSVMATATLCSSASNKRPTVAYMYIDPASVESPYMTNTATREIAHALGFSSASFKSFGMTVTTQTVRGHPVTLLTSPEVVAKAREQYGCPTLTGMEMSTDGLYWNKRNALYELMSPTVESRAVAYSQLTLAAFADTGVYEVNYEQADILTWGRNAGCDFINSKCVVNGVSSFPEFFCTAPRKASCTGDYRAYGGCAMSLSLENLPLYFQYWKYPQVGGIDSAMEYCPYVEGFEFGDCAGAANPIPEFVYGDTSRCMNGRDIQYTGALKYRQSLCVEVQFVNTNGVQQVKLRPKGGNWVSCSAGGAAGEVSIAGNGIFTSGYLTCPEYSRIYSPLASSAGGEVGEGGKKDIPAWVWGVVAVVCVVIALVVVGVVVYCCCCKNKAEQAAAPKETYTQATDGSNTMVNNSLFNSFSSAGGGEVMEGSRASHDKIDEVTRFNESYQSTQDVPTARNPFTRGAQSNNWRHS